LHRDEAAQRRIAPLKFLADQAGADGIEPGAAIALDRAAKKPHRGEFRNELLGKAVVLECFADDRQHLVVDHSRDRILNHALILAQ
jgi:hypothetical protein